MFQKEYSQKNIIFNAQQRRCFQAYFKITVLAEKDISSGKNMAKSHFSVLPITLFWGHFVTKVYLHYLSGVAKPRVSFYLNTGPYGPSPAVAPEEEVSIPGELSCSHPHLLSLQKKRSASLVNYRVLISTCCRSRRRGQHAWWTIVFSSPPAVAPEEEVSLPDELSWAQHVAGLRHLLLVLHFVVGLHLDAGWSQSHLGWLHILCALWLYTFLEVVKIYSASGRLWLVLKIYKILPPPRGGICVARGV